MEGLDYKNDNLKLHAKLLKIYQEVLNSNMDITDDFRRMAQENLARHKDEIEEARMEEGSDTWTNLSEFCKKCFPCLYRNKSEEPRTENVIDIETNLVKILCYFVKKLFV